MARRGIPDAQRVAVQGALDGMMEGFRHLDASQRTMRGMVESFRAYLPERAASSGLVPRFQVLDREADELVNEYLQVLDRFPFEDATDAGRLHAAQQAYQHLGPRLQAKADALDQVVLDYDAELTRIGAQVQRSRSLKDDAAALVKRVADGAGTLKQSGLDVPELNGLLARARTAATSASDWQPAAGARALEQAVAELESVVAQVEQLAVEYPQRVERARTRRASLETVAQAVESRLDRAPEDLAVLRREFSIGNWRDLDVLDDTVRAALADARAKLVEFDRLVAADEGWTAPLRLLEDVRRVLDGAKTGVGAPTERLRQLREVKADPESLLQRVRFRLRDAQLLVTHQPKPRGHEVGQQLDALAVRLDALRSQFTGAHPDYWSALQEATAIEDAVKQQVQRFRAL